MKTREIVLSIILLTCLFFTSTITQKVQKPFILKYTEDALPFDIIHISLESVVKLNPSFSFSTTTCKASILGDSLGATLVLSDTDPLRIVTTPAIPVYGILSLKEKIGIIEYQIACTSTSETIDITGSVVVQPENIIRSFSPYGIKFEVEKSFAASPEFIFKDIGYWSVNNIHGNNLKYEQKPWNNDPLTEAIPAVRPIKLMEKVNQDYVPLPIQKLKKIAFVCPSVPMNIPLNCLIAIKEDGNTAILFAFGAGFTNDYRWTKSQEKLLNTDANYVFDDCFMHVGIGSFEIICHFWNNAAKKTKLISIGTDTSVELAARVLSTKSINEITCLILDENGTKKLGCIKSQSAIISLIKDILPFSTNIVKILDQGVCSLTMEELIPRTIDDYLMFNCTTSKVIAKIDFSSVSLTGVSGNFVSFSKELPTVTGQTRKIDSSITVNTFLCGSSYNSIFLADGFKKIVYQGNKHIGQILSVALNVTGITSVTKVSCTSQATDFIAVSGQDKYFVSVNNMAKDSIEFERLHLVYKLGDKDDFDISYDGSMVIAFKKDQAVLNVADILEISRVPYLFKIFDPAAVTRGSQNTQIKVSQADEQRYNSADYRVTYISSLPPKVELLSKDKKMPQGVPFSMADFYNVTGLANSQVTIDPPNPDISVNPDALNITTTLPISFTGARFVLGRFYVDTDIGKYYDEAGASFDFQATNAVLKPAKFGCLIGGDVAITVDANDRKKVQFFSLNNSGAISVSPTFTVKGDMLEDSCPGKVLCDDGKPCIAVPIKSTDAFDSGVYAFIYYDTNPTTGAITFSKPSDKLSRHSFVPSQAGSPFGFDKYIISLWNDPINSHCISFILSEGDLTTPWVYRICSLRLIYFYYTSSIKGVNKVDKSVEIKVYSGSYSKEFGNSVHLIKFSAELFKGTTLAVPTQVNWNVLVQKSYYNGVGGLVKSLVEINKETVIITEEIPASKKMTVEPRNRRTFVSFFRGENMVAQWSETAPVSEAKHFVFAFNDKFRLLNQTDASTGKKTITKDLRVHGPAITFTDKAFAAKVASSSFVFNKGQPNEIKFGVQAVLNPAPPEPTSPPKSEGGWGLWIWVILFVIFSIIALAVYFLFIRRESIKRDSKLDQNQRLDDSATVTEPKDQ